MELDTIQIRVLGCLVEKAATTPDNYPMTTNSLVTACNQKSSRYPVMALTEREVDAAMLSLRQFGLARTLTGSGRTVKHRHVAGETLELTEAALAVISVLLLRGPQTVGELRTRTERQHSFSSLEEVDAVLESLAVRSTPLVKQIQREIGRKEPRWMHLLGDGVEPEPESMPATTRTSPIDELRAEVVELRARVDRLYELLGETEDSA